MSKTGRYSDQLVMAAQRSVKEREYWRKKLAVEPVAASIPADYSRRENNEAAGTSVNFEFPEQHPLREQLSKLSKGSDHTLHVVLTAGVLMLSHLYQYTGHENLTIGCPVFRKDTAGKLINNVLILCNRINNHMSVLELLTEVKNNLIGAIEHQNYPMEVLCRDLGFSDPGNPLPLLDMMVLLENVHSTDDVAPARPGLLFIFQRCSRGIVGRLEYRSSRYTEETARRLCRHLELLLRQALADIDGKIADIDLLTEGERERILKDFNGTPRNFPVDTTVQHLFAGQVRRFRDRSALAGPVVGCVRSGERHHLTYGELDRMAGELAVHIRSEGVKEAMLIGVMLERTLEMVVCRWAVLKAGAAFLSIDPAYPSARIDYMLDDSQTPMLLTSRAVVGESGSRRNCLYLEDLRLQSRLQPERDAGDESGAAASGNPAYAIYTSGSTGIPKGVVIEHHSLINLCCWHIRMYGVNTSDRGVLYSGTGFDAAIWEHFPYHLGGAGLYIVTDDLKLDLTALNRFFEKYHITIAFLPTQVCQQFMVEANRSLRILLTGGDKLQAFSANSYSLYNNYGPTENTVVTTAYPVTADCGNIPIGVPIDNTHVFLFDRENRRLQPPGIPGELCIAGESLARGYLNDPEGTAARFTRHGAVGGARIYRSGDLVSRRRDGNLEFLGRVDRQVKIRGMRIEKAEIESRLAKHPAVKVALVMLRSDRGGDRYLCAYVVAGDVPPEELERYLARWLPAYMIPSHIVPLDRLPVTPNGKVAYDELPDPRGGDGVEYVPPADEAEKRLAGIWADILALAPESIGVKDNFFRLGGHSLKAALLLTAIHKSFDVRLKLADIFAYPYIRRLVRLIKNAVEERYVSISPAEKKEYYVLSPSQHRLFLLQQLEPAATVNNLPQVIELNGAPQTGESLTNAFRRLIGRHESLRTYFQMVGDEPYQRIAEEVEFTVPEVEAEGKDSAGRALTDFVRPFDLARPPLLRVKLVKVRETGHRLLLVDIHHIISDGVSQNILTRDFLALLQDRDLPSLKTHYKDYAEWRDRNGFFKGERLQAQEDYWLAEFGGPMEALKLPTDFRRPEVQGFKKETIRFALDEAQTSAARKLAGSRGDSLFILMFALFNIFLARLTGQEDISVGTVTFGRDHADLHHVIGMFVHTLVIRNRPAGEKKIGEFIDEVREKLLGAMENQDYPIENVVSKLKERGELRRNFLLDVLFVLQNQMDVVDEQAAESMLSESDSYRLDSKDYTADLILVGVESRRRILFNCLYSPKLFEPASIEWLIDKFKVVINKALERVDGKIEDLDIRSSSEIKRGSVTPLQFNI